MQTDLVVANLLLISYTTSYACNYWVVFAVWTVGVIRWVLVQRLLRETPIMLRSMQMMLEDP